MKKLSIALLTLLMSASVFADQGQLLTASLTRINLQAGSFLSKQRINSGRLDINLSERKISLTLNRSWYCPPSAMCSMVMPAPLFYEVPLKAVKKGPCNTVVYHGEMDQRMVDGVYQGITVVDNSRNVCPNLMYLLYDRNAITTVTYQIRGQIRGQPQISEDHSFSGPAITQNIE